MILSVVIPVYNAKPYLRKCVESVSRFPIQKKEIILVDDGCTDGTFNDIDEWLDTLTCPFKVIHQINSGVSKARNVGMNAASGEWIWFVDSDDYVSSDVIIDFTKLNNSNFVITGFSWEEKGVKRIFCARKGEIPYNLWRCWFRKNLIDDKELRFVENRKYAEDQEFILKYIILNEKKHQILSNSYPIHELVYCYSLRLGSAMTKVGTRKKQVIDILKVLFAVLKLSIFYNVLSKSWVRNELKRLTKTLFVTIKR